MNQSQSSWYSSLFLSQLQREFVFLIHYFSLQVFCLIWHYFLSSCLIFCWVLLVPTLHYLVFHKFVDFMCLFLTLHFFVFIFCGCALICINFLIHYYYFSSPFAFLLHFHTFLHLLFLLSSSDTKPAKLFLNFWCYSCTQMSFCSAGIPLKLFCGIFTF